MLLSNSGRQLTKSGDIVDNYGIKKPPCMDGFSHKFNLVRMKGLEPSRPEALAPKACSTSVNTPDD